MDRPTQLLLLVYEELRKLAATRMASELPDHTLQATALVQEAYIRLTDAETALTCPPLKAERGSQSQTLPEPADVTMDRHQRFLKHIAGVGFRKAAGATFSVN